MILDEEMLEENPSLFFKTLIFIKLLILFIIQYSRTAHFGGVLVVPQGSQFAEAEGGNKQIQEA